MVKEFFFEFVPPRATQQGGRVVGTRAFLHWRGRIARATWKAVLEKHKPDKPLEGALALEIHIVFPHTRESAKRGVVVPKTTRPDGDNLVKAIKDVAAEVGYYHDDAQVYDERVKRFFGDVPGIYFKLSEEQ